MTQNSIMHICIRTINDHEQLVNKRRHVLGAVNYWSGNTAGNHSPEYIAEQIQFFSSGLELIDKKLSQ
ncbi:hypothetical protein DJ55_269 [Yersinia pseudotuberculosis]|nr:hypothetical protein DJ55_269 [Yersinia pseudotuberculosis]